MTGQSDDYLAQMERALERIEASSIDAKLAQEHAPHLVAAPDPGTPLTRQAPSETEKFDLGANLLQSDVDVSMSPANDIVPMLVEPADPVESGLGFALTEDARAVGESLSNVSLLPEAEPEIDIEASMPMDGPVLVAESAVMEEEPPARLRLETQAPMPGRPGQVAQPSMSASPAHSLNARTSMGSMGSLGSMGSRRASLHGAGSVRRGLFSENLGVNLLASLGIATWLALWPTKMLTEHWLREGSHVGLTQLREGPEASSLSAADRQELADGLLAQADAAQGRFLWTWALIAMAGTIVLTLPYRRGH